MFKSNFLQRRATVLRSLEAGTQRVLVFPKFRERFVGAMHIGEVR
jgi:hypothetical protein